MYMNKLYSRIAGALGLILLAISPIGAYARILEGDGGVVVGVQTFCIPELNLLQNPGFELPEITSSTWQIFTDSTATIWQTAWASPLTTGTPGLEIQNNVAGSPSEGSQFAELDGDHPTKISQIIATIPGKSYEVSYDFSARPGYGVEDNLLQVSINGSPLGDPVSADGSATRETSWSHHALRFVADNNSTTLQFSDLGADNSLGTYLDNTSFHCIGDPASLVTPEPVSTTGGGGGNAYLPACSDGIDNDGDGKIDMNDPGCSDPSDTTESPDVTITATTQGEVLGASTTVEAVLKPELSADVCTLHKYEVIKYGEENGVLEVSELQAFLNKTLHLSIFISGIYNSQTHQAAWALQNAHKNELLTPWATASDRGHDLKYWLLMTKCGELDIPA